MNKSKGTTGKTVALSVFATFICMWAVHKLDMFESIKHEVGLDD